MFTEISVRVVIFLALFACTFGRQQFQLEFSKCSCPESGLSTDFFGFHSTEQTVRHFLAPTF
jgi:hypothetical protein